MISSTTLVGINLCVRLDASTLLLMRIRVLSETSQTIGRAARNADGHVIMYADNMTDSMKAAIDETQKKRVYRKPTQRTWYHTYHNKEGGKRSDSDIKGCRECIDY